MESVFCCDCGTCFAFSEESRRRNKDRCDVLRTPFFTIRTGADGREARHVARMSRGHIFKPEKQRKKATMDYFGKTSRLQNISWINRSSWMDGRKSQALRRFTCRGPLLCCYLGWPGSIGNITDNKFAQLRLRQQLSTTTITSWLCCSSGEVTGSKETSCRCLAYVWSNYFRQSPSSTASRATISAKWRTFSRSRWNKTAH